MLGPKICGSKRILGPNNFRSGNFWAKKNLGPEKFWSKNLRSKRNSCPNILVKKKNLGQKKDIG